MDLSHEVMHVSTFDIAQSMMNGDIDSMNLSSHPEMETVTSSLSEDQSYATTTIDFSDTHRLAQIVVSVDGEESFSDLLHQATSGSGETSANASTRLRRRKATQPQRLIYCDLDFSLNDDASTLVLTNLSDANSCQSEQKEECSELKVEDFLNKNEAPVETEVVQDNTTKKGKGFECEICGSVWNSKTRLRCHYRTHGASKHLKCDICGKLFGWEYSWKTHMLAHSENNPNKCPHCGLKLFNKTALANHIKRIHENPDRPFKCNVCSKSFISKSELNQHAHIHNEDKPFMCERCGKTFRSKSYMERHYKTHSGVKPFKCEYCGKELTDKTGFTAHVRAHVGERPYSCDVCGKKYTIRRHLTSHMIIHSDLRPFKCDQCDKTFRSRTNFRMHKDSHLGIKRWSCKFCSRTFLSQGNMAKHVRRHIGERKHKCDKCDKAFIEKQELKNHLKMHNANNDSNYEKETNIVTTEIQKALPEETLDVNNSSNLHDVNHESIDLLQYRECANVFSENIPTENNETSHDLLTSLSPVQLTTSSTNVTTMLPVTQVFTVNFSQSYSPVTSDHTNEFHNGTSTVNFSDYQRLEKAVVSPSTNATSSSQLKGSQPMSCYVSQGMTLPSMPMSHISQSNQYLNDSQGFLHCNLCSDVFLTNQDYRDHLVDFHRVESDKVISMVY